MTDTVENTKAMLNALWEVIERHRIPAQNCVLAHVTTQMEPSGRGQREHDFQSISGSEKGLGEFGVSVGLLDEAYDLAGHYCQAAAQRHVLRDGAGFRAVGGCALRLRSGDDGGPLLRLRAAFFAVPRQHRRRLHRPEYLYDARQVLRAGLEDHFMGKLTGIPMGCDAATPTT